MAGTVIIPLSFRLPSRRPSISFVPLWRILPMRLLLDCPLAFELFHDLRMARPRHRIGREEGQGYEDGNRRERAEEELDAEEGAVCRMGRVGYVAEPREGPTRESDAKSIRELRNEVPHAIVEAFLTLSRPEFVVLHDVGKHAPGADPLGGESHAGHSSDDIDESSGMMGHEEGRSAGNRGDPEADRVRWSLADAVREEFHRVQKESDGAEHDNHDHRQLLRHLELVDQVIRQEGCEEREREVREKEAAHEPHEGLVLEG